MIKLFKLLSFLSVKLQLHKSSKNNYPLFQIHPPKLYIPNRLSNQIHHCILKFTFSQEKSFFLLEDNFQG